MIDRKTYLILPGDYKTLKSDFLGTLEASGKDVLVLTDCVTLKVGKTRFIISPLFAPIDPKRIVSKAFTKEEFTALMTEYHEGCTPEDIEALRFVPHIVEFIEEDGREILSSSYSQYQFFKQYPVTDTTYACTGFRVTRV